MNKRIIIILVSTLMAGGLTYSLADTHEHARQLRDQGEILPLESILENARAGGYPGKVIEVELEREYGKYIYEIEILDAEGRVWELKYDARSGEILSTELDD